MLFCYLHFELFIREGQAARTLFCHPLDWGSTCAPLHRCGEIMAIIFGGYTKTQVTARF
jgi:hypothetical protein